MGFGGGRKEQEGVVREDSVKGMTLSKFSKHGNDLVKRKWLPGQHISLNTSNMVEIEKACQRKPHIWASLAGAEILMRCAGVLSWCGGDVSGFWLPSTTEEMEHLKNVEVKLLDWEPLSVLPAQAQSQVEVHKSLRSWTQHLGHTCSTLETLHTYETIFWCLKVAKDLSGAVVFQRLCSAEYRPPWVVFPSNLKYLVGLPLWNSRSTHNSYHTTLSSSLIPKSLFFLGQG